jgi:hypothetical protein
LTKATPCAIEPTRASDDGSDVGEQHAASALATVPLLHFDRCTVSAAAANAAVAVVVVTVTVTVAVAVVAAALFTLNLQCRVQCRRHIPLSGVGVACPNHAVREQEYGVATTGRQRWQCQRRRRHARLVSCV